MLVPTRIIMNMMWRSIWALQRLSLHLTRASNRGPYKAAIIASLLWNLTTRISPLGVHNYVRDNKEGVAVALSKGQQLPAGHGGGIYPRGDGSIHFFV